MNRLLFTTCAAVLAMGTAASAATLTMSGGTAGTIPDAGQTNEIIADLGAPSIPGYFGSQIYFSGGSDLRIEFLGFEAGYANTFSFGGNVLFDTEDYASNTVLPSNLGGLGNTPYVNVSAAAGLLDFKFCTSGEGGVCAVNGSNPDDANPNTAPMVNFFSSIPRTYQTATNGNYLWLFFDDDGANNDDNHDDFAVRISAVPVPAGGLLLLSGLGALGLRRKRKAA